MTRTSSFWDAVYDEYTRWRTSTIESIKRGETFRPFDVSIEALARLEHPEAEDVAWITTALKAAPHEPVLFGGQPWFIAAIIERADSLAEVLFEPLLDAGINEVNPSDNRRFIEPCVRAFGELRTYEYLAHVLECGTDFEKAGAMNAMYWATGWSAEAEQPSLGPLRERVKRVVLQTFIRTANIDLRRALSRWMNLSEPETTQDLRELQGEALSIAERLDDDYIRHIVDKASGKTTLLKALPHRRRPDAD